MFFDRRMLLALALSALVILAVNYLFPGTLTSSHNAIKTDTTLVVHGDSGEGRVREPPNNGGSAPRPYQSTLSSRSNVAVVPETLAVAGPHAQYQFSNIGATPLSATMHDYRAHAPGTTDGVQIIQPGGPLLTFRAIVGADTIALDTIAFRATVARGADSLPVITFTSSVADAPVSIVYTLASDGYLWHVQGSLGQTAAGQGFLLIGLPTGLKSFEADTADDEGHLAYTVKPMRGDATGTPFSKLDPGEQKIQPGPITWAAARDKYFVVGVLAADTTAAHQLAEVDMTGGPRVSKLVTRASAFLVQPIATVSGAAGTVRPFAFDLYMGPQEWRRLHAIGRDFENVNPYGGILRPILQPLVAVTMETLLWMKKELQLNYGWILVIFGVVVRLVLWPFNQRAMQSSMKMQGIQPELAAVQKKYANDATKLQAEMMRVYREHGMSPFSPVAGCLPMLIPMPIFFALIFVFQNTIEFRGVPFLWLHDISVRDPLYIIPLVMGASMFLTSWIGLRNQPPNPQAKMMAYVFPGMMTLLFARFAAGVNLYYAVQNIAALPQQWLLSRARAAKTKPS